MSKRFLTSEKIAFILSSSRTNSNLSQKHMAKSLGKSISTIQNWENGYSTPNIIDMLDWFEECGISPLPYILKLINQDNYSNMSKESSNAIIDESLFYYINELATSSDKRKLAFCIFGNTGSSWSAQLDMITAHNHTTMRSRINVAQTIYDNYNIEKATGKLININNIMPNEINFEAALIKSKESVYNGKNGYSIH